FLSWIQSWIEHPKAAFNLIRAGRSGEFRISNHPTGRVPWNVQLWHNPDAAVAGVSDHIPHLFLRVEPPVGTHPLQLGKKLALDAKPLIVGQVPMKHIHL